MVVCTGVAMLVGSLVGSVASSRTGGTLMVWWMGKLWYGSL